MSGVVVKARLLPSTFLSDWLDGLDQFAGIEGCGLGFHHKWVQVEFDPVVFGYFCEQSGDVSQNLKIVLIVDQGRVDFKRVAIFKFQGGRYLMIIRVKEAIGEDRHRCRLRLLTSPLVFNLWLTVMMAGYQQEWVRFTYLTVGACAGVDKGIERKAVLFKAPFVRMRGFGRHQENHKKYSFHNQIPQSKISVEHTAPVDLVHHLEHAGASDSVSDYPPSEAAE
ncbi:MAG: hypothetical protein ABJL33_15435 [Hyphomicrobiales bacterium]